MSTYKDFARFGISFFRRRFLCRSAATAYPDIKTLALVYTWRCNSRCRFCFQWRTNQKPDDEIRLSEIETILRSKSLGNLQVLSISGGEPFLRNDFADVAITAKKMIPSVTIVTTTNGLLSDVIFENAKRVLAEDVKLQVQLSLNGPQEIHDWSRGVEGNFGRVLKTLELLKSLRDDRLLISVSAFYFPENIRHIPWLIRFADEHGLPVGLSRLQVHPALLNTELTGLPEQLKSAELKRMLNLAYRHKTIDITHAFYEDSMINGRQLDFECYQGRNAIFIYPYGDVYPCTLRTPELLIGNTREKTLTTC